MIIITDTPLQRPVDNNILQIEKHVESADLHKAARLSCGFSTTKDTSLDHQIQNRGRIWNKLITYMEVVVLYENNKFKILIFYKSLNVINGISLRSPSGIRLNLP